jgi:adenosylcobinamide kinase/adenosylcobinamide-phosphate guanylyltransferase
MLTVLLGGARSGKSALAERWAAQHAARGGSVAVLATGERLDDEMTARIERHRTGRPGDWVTIEEPLDLAGGVVAAAPDALLVVDCLTTWLGNVMFHDRLPDVDADVAATLAAITARPGHTVVISNEVALGIVPADATTREYRDMLGRINQSFVAASAEAYLMVAGRAVRLDPPPASRGPRA